MTPFNHSDYSDAAPKFGGAYTGWRPSEPQHSSWWLVVIGLIAVGVALWGLGL